MDQERFDRIARALGASGSRRAGLRAALGGLLGAGGIAVVDAEAKRRRRDDANAGKKKRRKKCKPACGAGQTCVKGTCTCDNGGTACGAECCLIGQACQGGQCVSEPTPTCVPVGEPCKGVGRACCDGRVCASGQGGEADVACYVAKTGVCATTADCVYGTACRDGRCVLRETPPPPAPLAAACDAASSQPCITPGAVCTAYTGSGAPGGDHCTLPLRQVCTGDPDCTCYRCWYSTAVELQGGREERSSANTKACCHPAGQACTAQEDCCLGLECVSGTCGGTMCLPEGAEGCGQGMSCCNEGDGIVCVAGTCVPETCNVYAECPTPGNGCWTSIKAAYDAVDGSSNPVIPAGGTIRIAPGDYTESVIELNRNITFRRCGTSGAVIWRNAQSGSYMIRARNNTDAVLTTALTLKNIDFRMGTDGIHYTLRLLGRSSAQRLMLTATGCSWRDFTNLYSSAGTCVFLDNFVNAAFTDCTFADNDLSSSGRGTAVLVSGVADDGATSNRSTVTMTNCTVSGNKSYRAGGAIYVVNTDMTVTGTTLTNNQSAEMGGAIMLGSPGEPGSLSANNQTTLTLADCTLSGNVSVPFGRRGGGAVLVSDKSSLTLTGTTTITGNTAGTYGSGIQAVAETAANVPTRITGTTTANVTGNTPAPDCQIIPMSSGDPPAAYAVSCSGWCVASGGTCNNAHATCCSGSCSAATGNGTCNPA